MNEAANKNLLENSVQFLAEQDSLNASILGPDAGVGTPEFDLFIEEAAKEVGRPVFFAVLIIIIVFAPLFSLEGVEGKLFQPMAISIVLAMFASLLVALIVIPALASYVFKRGVVEKNSPVLRPIEKQYRLRLKQALAKKPVVVITAIMLFIASLALVPFLGTEFVPELEEGTINIRVTLAPSSSMDTSLKVANEMERILMTFPEVKYATSRIGRAEIGGDPGRLPRGGR